MNTPETNAAFRIDNRIEERPPNDLGGSNVFFTPMAPRMSGDSSALPPTEEHFQHLWKSAEPEIMARARWLAPSGDQARELVQKLAVLAIEHQQKTSFGERQDLVRWCYPRLRWLLLTDLRGVRRMLPLEEVEEPGAQAPQEMSTVVRSSLQRAMRELPKRQRDVIRQTAHGRSTSEIASRLGVKQSTVRSLLRFARSRLALYLKDEKEECTGGKKNGTPRTK